VDERGRSPPARPPARQVLQPAARPVCAADEAAVPLGSHRRHELGIARHPVDPVAIRDRHVALIQAPYASSRKSCTSRRRRARTCASIGRPDRRQARRQAAYHRDVSDSMKRIPRTAPAGGRLGTDMEETPQPQLPASFRRQRAARRPRPGGRRLGVRRPSGRPADSRPFASRRVVAADDEPWLRHDAATGRGPSQLLERVRLSRANRSVIAATSSQSPAERHARFWRTGRREPRLAAATVTAATLRPQAIV
jgi:hypothetical protein